MLRVKFRTYLLHSKAIILTLCFGTSLSSNAAPATFVSSSAFIISSNIGSASAAEVAESRREAEDLLRKFLVSPAGLDMAEPDRQSSKATYASSFDQLTERDRQKVAERIAGALNQESSDEAKNADIRFGEALDADSAESFLEKLQINVGTFHKHLTGKRRLGAAGILMTIVLGAYFPPMIYFQAAGHDWFPMLWSFIWAYIAAWNLEGFFPPQQFLLPNRNDRAWNALANDLLRFTADGRDQFAFYSQSAPMSEETISILLRHRTEDQEKILSALRQQMLWTAARSSFMRHLPPRRERAPTIWVLLDMLVWKVEGQPLRMGYLIRTSKKRPTATQTATESVSSFAPGCESHGAGA